MVAIRLKSAFALAALALVAAAAPAAANDYASAKNGRIAFVLEGPGEYNGVYTVPPDGGRATRVRFVNGPPQRPSDPVFSPNGRELALGSWRNLHCLPGPTGPPGPAPECEGVYRVHIVSLASGRQEVVRASEYPSDIFAPSDFSPDGRGLLFLAGQTVSYTPIGKGPIRPVSVGYDGVFSPDGRRVALEGWSRRGLDLVSSDGKQKVVLTDPANPADDMNPAFSPAGDRVVFERDHNTSMGGDIYSVRVDGTGLTNLTAEFEPRAVEPDFSPDGNAIVFVGMDTDGPHLYRMNSGGSDPIQLPTSGLPPAMPSWGGTFRCAGKLATIVGDDGPDKIRGTKRADVIVGNAGRDRIAGRGGRDRICGGRGNDALVGGGDRDKMVGGPGKDSSRQ